MSPVGNVSIHPVPESVLGSRQADVVMSQFSMLAEVVYEPVKPQRTRLLGSSLSILPVDFEGLEFLPLLNPHLFVGTLSKDNLRELPSTSHLRWLRVLSEALKWLSVGIR